MLADNRPCLNKVPCGGEGLPTSVPGATTMKLAAMADPIALPPTPASRPFATVALLRPAEPIHSRLDEPPEGFPV